MKPEQGGGPGAGPVDPGLAHRVEGLVDEAVALAAKGSYREAADRAEQARALDPENRVARDLIESYRRLAQDDDERRRRRRSIAAAAAAIEEMIESGRLEESATAVEALSLQYGVEAPVDELRGRIAVARANDEGFEELDAAIDAIRQPASARAATPPPRLDAVGTLAAEIEDHLRAGRLEEAGGRLDKLEAMPGSEERLHKLRTRIEEARHVADEHRREEEILIATAAIEERIRRGSIDEAAERLEALASRHGSSAPIAELRQRLQEAQDAMPAAAAQAAAAAQPSAPASAAKPATGARADERTGELVGEERPGVTHDAAFDAALVDSGADAAASGERKRIALIAAALVAVLAAGWWLTRPSQEAAPSAPTSTEEVASAAGTDALASDAAAADVAGGTAEETIAPSRGEAPVETAQSSASRAAIPGVDQPPAGAPEADPPPDATQAVEAPPSAAAAVESAELDDAGNPDAAPAGETVVEAGATEAAASDALRDGAPGADPAPETTELTAPDTPAPEAAPAATAADNPADVVVDALPAGAEPAVPRPEQSAAEEPAAGAPEVTAAPPPAEARPDGAERVAAAPESAPVPATAAPGRPLLLGCGEPGVVCVKPVRVPQPSYPPIARQRRLSASVVVFALVDETGRVIETRVDQGAAMRFFNDAAEEAARRAVFQPASRGGVPGRSWARLAFQFSPR